MEELDLKYLQYALAVVRYGSVTQAARALYLAQPNLSRAIGELEQSLGFPLFLRTRQGMSLTPQGERFLTEAETLLDRMPVGLCLLRRRPDGGVELLRANQVLSRLLGLSPAALARRLAAELGYIYVDTGAMFRTIGLYALRAGKDPKDNEAVNALLPEISLKFAFIGGEQHIYLNGEDVSDAIRAEIMAAFRQLGNEVDFMILFRRYILLEDWGEIAYHVRLSRSQVFQHHSAAVKRLDPKSPDETGLDRT